MEKWKLIPSDPSLEASSKGRIRVRIYFSSMPYGGVRKYGGIPTTGQWNGTRYIYCRKGYKTRKVARLICEAFHGLAPKTKPCCLHKDENSRNNKPNNLHWGTQKENLNCLGFIIYCKSRTGINNPYVKGTSN